MSSIYDSCPLPSSKTIRLIVLKPSSDPKKGIECGLQAHSLDSPSILSGTPYTTLSYTWGKPTARGRIIHVHGEPLKISPNLYSALQDLRRPDAPLYIWADAICIDQANDKERSEQVQQMRSIYANAEQTVIYLGADEGDKISKAAWDFLKSQSQLISTQDTKGKETSSLKPQSEKEIAASKRGYGYLLQFVTRCDWFRRIWVVQEAVVSKELLIQFGQRRMRWDDFCKILFLSHEDASWETSPASEDVNTPLYDMILTNLGKYLSIFSQDADQSSTLPLDPVAVEYILSPVKSLCQARVLYQKAHNNKKMPIPEWVMNGPLADFVEDDSEFRSGSLRLAHLLHKNRRLQASDTRDKVFALIGISAESSQSNTGAKEKGVQNLVDYKKSEGQVFRETTRWIMEHEGTFDILGHAGDGNETRADTGDTANSKLPLSSNQSREENSRYSSWAGKWSSPVFPPLQIISRLGGENETFSELRRACVREHHTFSPDGNVFGCTGGTMGTLIAINPLGIPPPSNHYRGDHSWLREHMDLVDRFIPIATDLLNQDNGAWCLVPEDRKKIEVLTRIVNSRAGHMHVEVELTGRGLTEEEMYGAGVKDEDRAHTHFIAGGYGFLDDVEALQDRRMLGLVRSHSPRLERTRLDKNASYSWAVVPENARVGDLVASFTGSRVLFLVYSDTLSESPKEDGVSDSRAELEAYLRANLPPDKGAEAKIKHIRLRGECRVSGFEDMWDAYKKEDVEGDVGRRPFMTQAGFIPSEWTSYIMAIT